MTTQWVKELQRGGVAAEEALKGLERLLDGMSGLPPKEVAEELGISVAQLYRLRKMIAEGNGG